ncbi:MAG: hypothetical protein QOH06_2313 [Acidobacteriota bacterium]|jgi:hypothetical protein|nr:hypothetical protein [Acidobacteriota bacterium]
MSSIKTFACACLLAAGVIGSAAGAEPEGLDAAAVSALRNHAQTRIVEILERRAVRPIAPAIVAADARRLASRLDEAKLRAIAAGEDIEGVVEEATLKSTTAAALGSSLSELVFVPLPPCRIIDTRLGSGGPIAAGQTRDFQVAGVTEFPPQGGNQGGCGVPPGSAEPNAPAVVVNFVAVGPAGPGNLTAWAWGQPQPNTSVINYSNVPGLNIANGVVVSIAGTNLVPADLHIRAGSAATHVVADVTGYFTRFPMDQFAKTEKSITVVSDGGPVDLSLGACTLINSCTITAEAPGQVIVRTWAQVSINHGVNVGGDRIAVGVKNADPTLCTNNDQSINATDFEVPDSLPADSDVDTTLSHKRIYAQGKGTATYYINAKMITGAGAGDGMDSTRMICTFIPD